MNENERHQFFWGIVCFVVISFYGLFMSVIFSGCQSGRQSNGSTRIIDTGEVKYSEELQRELWRRNQELTDTLNEINDLIIRAGTDNTQSGDSIDEVEYLIREYFGLVRGVQDELNKVKHLIRREE